MKGRWLRGGLRTHFRTARHLELEGLEARRLLTSSISGTNVVAVAGQDTTLDVANFQADATLDFASATINWGDGSADTPGVINHDASTDALSTNGDITGEHTYSQPGTYTIAVTAQESGSIGSGQTATVTSTATVAGVINPGPVLSPTVAQGVAFNALTVATFTTQLQGASASDFTATIDWGDNSGTSQGTIVPAAIPLISPGAVSNAGSSSSGSAVIIAPGPTPIPFPTAAFAVTGGHTYATSGTFTATITISDTNGDTATTTADITVASSSLSISAQGQNVSAVTGEGNVPLVVASFTVSPSTTDPSTALATPGDFQATIDWGDGTTPTSGQIFFAVLDPPGGPIEPQGWTAVPKLAIGPGYFVEGEHDYTQAGTDTITVTITGPGGASATATSTATVTNPTSQGQAQGVSFSATTNQPDTNQRVAFFPAAGPNDSPANYTATIDWGDGSTPTTGTVTRAPVPTDGSGASGSGSSGTATVPQSSGGTAVSQPIIVADQFAVSGDHTYTMAGTYTVTVTITDLNGNTTQSTTSTATVSNDTITAYPLPVAVQTNQPNAAINVAGFSDQADLPASDFTVAIDWGDGSTPTSGTVFVIPPPTGVTPDFWVEGEPGPGITGFIYGSPYDVSGQHSYSTPGQYTITVTITSSLGAQASVTTTADVTSTPPVPFPIPVVSQPVVILTPIPTPTPVPQPAPGISPVIVSTSPANTVTSTPITVLPSPVPTPTPVSLDPGQGNATDPPSNVTDAQSDPPPGQVSNTIQPQPTVTLGTSHPGKGAKKHHPTPKEHGAKSAEVKAAHPAAEAARRKHKPA